ncbi:MAG: NAD+ synthase [Phycisphaeraceae bacterium]|nr:NAD+ synthase [Phycisphaeraceae bacterium]
MRLALIQFNPTVGNIDANAQRMAGFIDRARSDGASLVVFPELALCGYPPRDLLLCEGFVPACVHAAKRLGERHTAGLTAVFGCPLHIDQERPHHGTANSLLVYADGRYLDYHDKRLLPTYDVFDEDRYFEPGDRAVVVRVGAWRVGLSVCEDLWKGEDAGFASRYAHDPDPVEALARAGMDLLVNPSASPFVLGKGARHRDILRRHATRHGVWVAAVNQVGGNDDLVFDGHAAIYDPRGRPAAFGPGFEESIVLADLPDAPGGTPEGGGEPADPLTTAPLPEQAFRALVLGTRDYVRKTGHARAIIGLSGGIDSAVTACIAVAALGRENITGVAMPGKYSSEGSIADARDLADRLGIRLLTVPIAPAFDGFRASLDPALHELGEQALGERLPDVAEQNLQSRARGTTLMALSNRTGALVLTTGNKSELAVGYCTLYGDMNGGLAVLADVTKRLVYDLARWMNANPRAAGFTRSPVPDASITKPPSAELAPDQRDQDTLPPYDVLDEIVARYVERHESPTRIIDETGFDEQTVRRVVRLIDANEYKRRQLATGIKITSVAFGTGRRRPIAQGWRST